MVSTPPPGSGRVIVTGDHATEHPRDAGWTLAGVLGGRFPCRVDPAGLVTPAGSAWSVDWWLGTGDRWYLPAREPTVRQRRVGAGPVIETAVKIPSGDAVSTAYGAIVGGREVTVVDIRNDSSLPVALALALRPTSGAAGPLRLDGLVVRQGADPLLVLPGAPRDAGASDRGDVLDSLATGQSLSWDGPAAGPGASAVVVFPLPHRAALRFCVLAPGLDARGAGDIDPARAPEASAVARGWSSVVESTTRFRFPDPAMTSLFGAARARLLLTSGSLGDDLADLAPGSGAVLAGLGAGGHRVEVGAGIEALGAVFPSRLGGSPRPAAEIVAGAALAVAASGAPVPAALVEAAAQLTHLVERAGDPAATGMALDGLARLARLAGDGAAQEHLARRITRLGAGPRPETGPELVAALSAEASAAGAMPGAGGADDAAAAARFVLAARSAIIDDGGTDLALLPHFPGSWRGGPVEVHGAPTLAGTLSFAIRWHGYRPALLWELARPDPGRAAPAGPTSMSCPGLDPAWTSSEDRGETLLGGISQPLPAPPAAGESFS